MIGLSLKESFFSSPFEISINGTHKKATTRKRWSRNQNHVKCNHYIKTIHKCVPRQHKRRVRNARQRERKIHSHTRPTHKMRWNIKEESVLVQDFYLNSRRTWETVWASEVMLLLCQPQQIDATWTRHQKTTTTFSFHHFVCNLLICCQFMGFYLKTVMCVCVFEQSKIIIIKLTYY